MKNKLGWLALSLALCGACKPEKGKKSGEKATSKSSGPEAEGPVSGASGSPEPAEIASGEPMIYENTSNRRSPIPTPRPSASAGISTGSGVSTFSSTPVAPLPPATGQAFGATYTLRFSCDTAKGMDFTIEEPRLNRRLRQEYFKACPGLVKVLDGRQLDKNVTTSAGTGGSTVRATCENGLFIMTITEGSMETFNSIKLDDLPCREIAALINNAGL